MFKAIKLLLSKFRKNNVVNLKYDPQTINYVPVYDMGDVKINTSDSIEDTIIKLRNMGKTQLEISQMSGLTVNQVKGKIQKLLKQGKIERKYKKNNV